MFDGREISAGPGDGFAGRGEDVWKAHKRALEVAWGRLDDPARDFRKTGADNSKGGEQPRDRSLDLKDGPAAAGGHHGGVAGKLDGVAKTLLGVEENALAVQRFALPARNGKDSRPAVNLAEMPTGFVIAPALAPVAHAELGEGEIVACAGMVGLAVHGRLVRRQRLLHPAHIEQ